MGAPLHSLPSPRFPVGITVTFTLCHPLLLALFICVCNATVESPFSCAGGQRTTSLVPAASAWHSVGVDIWGCESAWRHARRRLALRKSSAWLWVPIESPRSRGLLRMHAPSPWALGSTRACELVSFEGCSARVGQFHVLIDHSSIFVTIFFVIIKSTPSSSYLSSSS